MQLLSIFLHKTLLSLPPQAEKIAVKGEKMRKREIKFTVINIWEAKP